MEAKKLELGLNKSGETCKTYSSVKRVEIKSTVSDKFEKQLYPKITCKYKILPTYHTCCVVYSWWP